MCLPHVLKRGAGTSQKRNQLIIRQLIKVTVPARYKSSGKMDVFPDGKADWRHVVREIERFPGWESWLGTSCPEKDWFSGWDGSPETSCPGKGPVFRMGKLAGDMSSGKLNVFRMGKLTGDKSSGKRDGFPDGMAVQTQVVRENGCFPGWES